MLTKKIDSNKTSTNRRLMTPMFLGAGQINSVLDQANIKIKYGTEERIKQVLFSCLIDSALRTPTTSLIDQESAANHCAYKHTAPDHQRTPCACTLARTNHDAKPGQRPTAPASKEAQAIIIIRFA
jgi:hypothetical protein